MIIWKGLGILVPLVIVPAYFLTTFILNDINHPFANPLLFWMASPFCLALSFAIKKYRRATCDEAITENKRTGKEKVVLVKRHTNKKTGEVFETIMEDSFFFIPVRFWFVVCIVLGACYYFFNN
jgi:uncharacterized protein YacL